MAYTPARNQLGILVLLGLEVSLELPTWLGSSKFGSELRAGGELVGAVRVPGWAFAALDSLSLLQPL